MFYCMRCSQLLLTDARSSGVQVVLHFEGDVTKTLAVYSRQQPQQIESIEIDGSIIRITLAGDVRIERSSVSLFDVLCQGSELWNLE